MNSDAIKCPKCGSSQIHVDKRGFKIGRAVAGTLLTGGLDIGAVSGGIGMNKIKLTCLSCGKEFKIGEQAKTVDTEWEIKAKEFEKHVIDKNEVEKAKLYKCDCGKESSLLYSNPICPKCGRRLGEKHLFTPIHKSGCLGFLTIPIIIILLFIL